MGISWEPNLKLSFPRFNLPCRVTCPHRTPGCSRYCYAYKAERMWPAVRHQRAGNLLLAKSPGFVNWMCGQLQDNPVPVFRIHEAGDFYSLGYFRKWARIARAFPRTRFYAFTKEFALFREARPKNFTLIASQFYDEQRELPAGVPVFQTVQHGEVGVGQKCHGLCEQCGICPFAKSGLRVWTERH